MIISGLTAVLGGTAEAGAPPAALSPETSAERPDLPGLRTGDQGGGGGRTEETGGELLDQEQEEEEEVEENGNLVELEEVGDEKFKEKMECDLMHLKKLMLTMCTPIHKIYSITYEPDYLILLRYILSNPLANLIGISSCERALINDGRI